MGEFPTTIAIYIWHSQFSYQRNNLYYRLFTFTYIYHLYFLMDPSTFSGSIWRTFLSKSRIILLSHPQIRAERRRHLGTCEHDRGQTLGLNSEGEARGSLPWENDGDDMDRKMGGGSWSFPRMGVPKNGWLILKFIRENWFFNGWFGVPPMEISRSLRKARKTTGVFLHRTTPIFPPSPSQHLPTTSLVQKLGCILFYPKIAILFTNKTWNSTIK